MVENQTHSVSVDQLSQLITFLNTHLRPQCSWSIAQEYPSVFQSSNLHNLQIIEEDSQIVAHAALKILNLRTPYGIMRVGAIGSVLTDPHFRQKGLSLTVLNRCVELANQQDCDFAILWSDLYDFYGKIGFSPSGYENIFEINSDLPQGNFNYEFRTTPQIPAMSLLNLYQKHSTVLIRQMTDVDRFLKIPNSEVYTAWENQTMKAYAVIGKGLDLQSYIHEWGGSLPDLMWLIQKLYVFRNHQPLSLLVPQHSDNLMNHLTQLGLSYHQGFLGLVRILKTKRLITTFQSKALTRFKGLLALNPAGTEIKIAGQAFALNDDLLRQVLFGPIKDLNLINGLLNSKIDPKSIAIDAWVWGWDSV